MELWKIKLSQDKYTVVDEEDYKKYSGFNWFYSKRGYAEGRMGGKRMLKLHRLISNAPDGLEVDHINRDKLDNRKSNLKICTHLENMQNQNAHRDNSSGHKFIYWYASRKKWQVQIYNKQKKINVGYFENLKDAIYHRDTRMEAYGIVL